MKSEDTQIARSALSVAFFVLAAKAVAAAKEIVVAWKYGVGPTVDAYQAASTYVLWLPSMVAAAMTVVLVPLFVQLRNDRKKLATFVAELSASSLVLGVVLGLIGILITPFLLPYFVSGLKAEFLEMARSFCWGLGLPAVLTLFIALHSARLMSVHRQWNSLFEGIPALSILAFILMWPSQNQAGIAPLIWGTIVGYVLQNAILSRIAKANDNKREYFKFSFKSPMWKESRNFIGLMLLAQFLMSWVTPIDMATATSLSEGSIARFSYAERIVSLFLGLGAVAISRAILPVFSELAADDNLNRLRNVAFKWGILMFLSGALTAAVCWQFAEILIRALFERGTFTSEDTIAVAEVFRWALIRLPFFFLGLVLFQLLASQRLFVVVLITNLTCALLKYPLNQYFSTSFDVAGINMATATMYAWSALCLLLGVYFFLPRRKV